jgi:DNA ligase-1
VNSDAIFDAIEEIASTSSKTGKEALVAKHGANGKFLAVLEAALNPFKTYGIAKRPEVLTNLDGVFDTQTWVLLTNLETRTLTGNAARESLVSELTRLTTKSAELLWRIVSKDLRAGFSESTVNKAIPGTVPTFDCMLAHKFEAHRVKKWPVVAEPKLDGVRVLAFVDITKPSVHFFSRSGKEFTTFDHLKGPLLRLIDDFRADLCGLGDDYDAEYFSDRVDCEDFAVVFDGEIVSGSFNKTVSEVRRKDAQATDAIFNVFDILPMSLFSKDDKVPSKHTYTERRQVLNELLPTGKSGPVHLLPRYLVSSEAEIDALYESVQARGLEGLIIKDDAPYYRRRNHAWMKIKAEESTDVPIVGFEEGTGKYEGMLGAIIVAFDKTCHENGAHGANHDHPDAVRVNVGSGLSDSQRQSFWEDREALIGRVIEVEFHEITPDGSLRHPRFKRFRDDKA